MATRSIQAGAPRAPATHPRESAGTPKVIADARERFADAAEEAAALLKKSGQDATGELFQTLVRLSDAAARSQTAIRAAIKMLPNNSDADSSLAVMELADGAGLEMCRDAWSAAGLAMVVLGGDTAAKAEVPRIGAVAAKARAMALNHAPSKLLAGAEACRAMLASIEALGQLDIRPTSESDADVKAAYAGQYADVDEAVSMALDQYGDSAGFRIALGSYLLTVAGGNIPATGAGAAEGLLTDGGFRSMPSEPPEEVDALDIASKAPGALAGTAPQRLELATEAAYEIEAIARTLQQLEDNDDKLFLARGVMLRLEVLSGIVMSITGTDDGRDLATMRRELFGIRNTATEARHG